MLLKKPSGAFIEIAKVWHQDQTLNKLTGFGGGQAGILSAAHSLNGMLPTPPPGIKFFALWADDTTPIGYTAYTDWDDHNRTADLHITLPPVHQGQGLGVTALQATVEKGFNQGLWRITFKPIVTNQRAVETAAKVGFKVEARTRGSIWMDSGPKDQTQMRLIRPEWEKKNGTRRRRS